MKTRMLLIFVLLIIGVASTAQEPHTYVWIGYFRGTVTCNDGQQKPVNTLDSLGIWSDRQFLNRHLEDQVRRAIQNWGDTWAKQRCVLSDASLTSVRDIAVPINPPGD